MIDSIVKEKKRRIWAIVVRSENQIHVNNDDRDEKWKKMLFFCERRQVEQNWWKSMGLFIGQAN